MILWQPVAHRSASEASAGVVDSDDCRRSSLLFFRPFLWHRPQAPVKLARAPAQGWAPVVQRAGSRQDRPLRPGRRRCAGPY